MMKLREYIKMALLAVLFLISFVSGKTVQAADDSPYIVFENEPNNTPDLYVSKKVASDTTGSMPDATFRFSVKVNGSFYSNKTYRMIGPDGKELYQVAGPDGTIIETSDPGRNSTVEYTTDRNGEFTLKEGQTAWFQYVGNGAECVVSEVGYELPKDAEGSFTQTTPPGGVSWQGVIDADGTTAEFVNRYDSPDNTPESDVTSLTVEKTVAWPSGYVIPDAPDFTFEIQLADETGIMQPLKDEKYILEDAEGNKDTYKTDKNGNFSLKAGQKAVFPDIPTGRDYKISEKSLPGGWRTVGEAVKEGGTVLSMPPVTFQNALASFAVVKRMDDYSTPEGEKFTFRLTGSGKEPLSNVGYYLYGKDKKFLQDGDSNTHHTDANGEFTLEAGEIAVFVGMEPGTVYNVEEEKKEGYVLQTPVNDFNGYMSQTVESGIFNEHIFVNSSEQNSFLSVRKEVDSDTPPLDSPDFTFILLKKDAESYVPVPDATYYVQSGNEALALKTDAEGKFRIKRDQAAEFRSLPQGNYKVVETDLPDGYTIGTDGQDGWMITLGSSEKEIVCTNLYTPTYKLSVSKEVIGSETDSSFSFKLKLALPDGSDISELKYRLGEESGELTVNQDGYFEFHLKHGETIEFSGLPDGTEYEIQEMEEKDYTVEVEGNSGTIEAEDILVKFINHKNITAFLPFTGGAGIYGLMFISLLLGITGVGILVWLRRKK